MVMYLCGGSVSGPLQAGGGVIGAKRVDFSTSGDFISQSPTPAQGGIVTVPLGSTVLPNGADPTSIGRNRF